MSLAFSKISILFLYIRIFTYHHARIAAWILLAIVLIYNIYGFCSTFLICRPLQAWWDFTITEKKCIDTPAAMWAFIGLHIATDFSIFIVPIPVVWGMTMPIRQKIGVLLVFALGFL